MSAIKMTMLAVAAALSLALSAAAAFPPFMNYQGKLTDASGNPVPDATYNVVFTIYDAPTEGTALWTSGTVTVTTKDGLFSTILEFIDPPVFVPAAERFLGIKVGADPEMTPRTELLTVPFAYNAYSATYSETCPVWDAVGNKVFRSTGNVGIGETNPSNRLVVGKDITPFVGNFITVGNDVGQSGVMVGEDQFNYGSISWDAYYDMFGISAISAASGGYLLVCRDYNVGIGTISPGVKLDVQSDGSSDGFRVTSADGSQLFRVRETSGGGCETFVSDADGNTGVLLRGTGDSYFTGGYVGIGATGPTNILTVQFMSSTDPVADAWTTYSSRRWKENIQPLHGSLEKVLQLKGVSFDWREGGKHDIGLIAEEVGAVIPEAVVYEDNGVDASAVDYGRLTPALIEAIKELKADNDQLREELEQVRKALNFLVQQPENDGNLPHSDR